MRQLVFRLVGEPRLEDPHERRGSLAWVHYRLSGRSTLGALAEQTLNREQAAILPIYIERERERDIYTHIYRRDFLSHETRFAHMSRPILPMPQLLHFLCRQWRSGCTRSPRLPREEGEEEREEEGEEEEEGVEGEEEGRWGVRIRSARSPRRVAISRTVLQRKVRTLSSGI